jgi:hypothetical protein
VAERPLDTDVERRLIALLVVDRPVESETTPLALAPMPEEADVDREPTELVTVERPLEAELESRPTALFVVESPVESETTPLALALMPEEADVERDTA